MKYSKINLKYNIQISTTPIMKKPYYLPSILVPVFILVNSFFFAEEAFAQCEPIDPITSGSGTFVVPEGVTSITVEVWGGGGRGGSRTSNGRGGGGGGGAYSQSVFPVTQGQTFNYSVGAGSSTTAAGGDTWFGSATTLMAKGGASVPNNTTGGALGGQATAGFGDIKFNGGRGFNASISGPNFSGGGGSSASSNGNGLNLTAINATSAAGATAPIGGGNGGVGRPSQNSGGIGNFPGGGGGGAVRTSSGTRDGGAGGNGQIIITYTCPCFTVLDDGAVTGVTIIRFLGNCAWEAPEGLLDFEVLVVGGGGGGGYGNGGGGGGAGIVHARVDVEARLVSGLPAGSIFQIQVGSGGSGAIIDNVKGLQGSNSTFDQGGLYQIIAGGGGGGGSESNPEGGIGLISSRNLTTPGFSTFLLRGGSGGGGADGEDGGDGQNGGGNGGEAEDDESGGGGGGSGGNGQNSVDEDGGNGGAGLQFLSFDIISNRFFGAGGGGGGQGDAGNGGSGGSGGAGGAGEDGDPLPGRLGRNGVAPGSGGGGGAEEARGGNGARGMVFIGFANSRILPVEYVSLEAEFSVEERQTELTWTTSMERANSHFEVQRSSDGLKSWEVIGNVDGMGWSDAPVDYRFEDVNPSIAGGTIYYRLNQVDFDGTANLSKVLSIKVPGVQFTQGVWRAYPNPTSGEQLRVSLLDKSQYSGEDIAFKIIHPTSISKAVSVTSENEMNEAISQMIRSVPKGVFVFELTWGQKIEHIKVLKK